MKDDSTKVKVNAIDKTIKKYISFLMLKVSDRLRLSYYWDSVIKLEAFDFYVSYWKAFNKL